MANDVTLNLRVGDPVPKFSGVTHDGVKIGSAELRGTRYVLYFYPKDDTPGCTKEACGFRDLDSEFQKRGVRVIGVSTDSVKSHAKFAEKYQLTYSLLADEEKRTVTAFGVWGEKRFMGRRYQGTHRVTFLIGPDARIERIWTQVKAPLHAREVLDSLVAT